MKKEIKILIRDIEKSNLSEIHKQLLIDSLSKEDLDVDKFLNRFLSILSISKELLNQFDIDIGDLLNKLLK